MGIRSLRSFSEKSTRYCLKVNNAECCNGSCRILNMTFTSEIYRRLDFDINILDEADDAFQFKKLKLAFLLASVG